MTGSAYSPVSPDSQDTGQIIIDNIEHTSLTEIPHGDTFEGKEFVVHGDHLDLLDFHIFEEEHAENSNVTTFRILQAHWAEVEIPMSLAIFVLCVLIIKVLLSNLKIYKVSNDHKLFKLLAGIFTGIPESCYLIIIGMIIGAMVPTNTKESTAIELINILLTPETFFLYILPPIVFDAGYEMPRMPFINNIKEFLRGFGFSIGGLRLVSVI